MIARHQLGNLNKKEVQQRLKTRQSANRTLPEKEDRKGGGRKTCA